VRAALRYLGGRLAWAIVVIVGVATLAFVVSELLPGDPARMLLGPQASPADVARAREIYGFDQPIPVKYARFVKRLVHRGPTIPPAARERGDHRSCVVVAPGMHLDLGYSVNSRRPVVDLLADRAPRTLKLAIAALALQLLLGLSAGMVAAARRGTRWDEIVMSLSLVGVSVPTFLIGLALQYVFAYKLRVLPYDGYGSSPAEHLRSLALPALTLGLFGSSIYARLTRTELRTLLAQDYVRTARAKGASATRALVVHAMRNALVPLSTLMALDFAVLLSGAMITERLFRWPGVGQLTVDAVLNRDGPVIFGTVLWSASGIVGSMLALDLAYVLLDPRLRRADR
jgi:peptide/nickel transport system permease protein